MMLNPIVVHLDHGPFAYAMFRLTEGVGVYFLAKQMGTSVQMIEKHYGHVTPLKNADRILQGLPGWEPAAVPSESR